MESGILPPELKSVEQLFTPDATFSVPLYQRSFAWGPDEIEELWEDLLSAIARRSDYFLGTIVLQKHDSAQYDIIDGQQRLACLTMIFSSIRNMFIASKDDRAEQVYLSFMGARDFTRDSQPKSRLVLNRINNETFLQYVIASKSIESVNNALRVKGFHESNNLLLQAYKFFLEKVTSEAVAKGVDSDSFLVPLIDCLRSSVKFIAIPVTSTEDAHLFFESLNARGKELAISDLVKNRLYYEAEDQHLRAQQLWEHMENELTRQPIPEFLRHYWIAERADAKNLSVREKQLYRAIADYVAKGKQAAALNLLADLDVSAHHYASISDYNLWPDEDEYGKSFEDSINDLRLFGVTQCNPLLLNAIRYFRDPAAIARTFRIVANFSFRYFIIGKQSPGGLERESAKIAFRIREGTLASPKEIAEAFLSINPDQNFRSDFTLARMPPTRARIARYLLAKLSNYMAKTAKQSGSEQIANPDAKQVTLEHVLPQSFGPDWQADFPKGIDPADFKDRVGNLTLLTTNVNAQAANASFLEKQRIALQTSSLPINAMFTNFTNKWDNDAIEQRQAQMAKIALEVWKL